MRRSTKASVNNQTDKSRDSESFEEPSTPENQTAYSLPMESTRRSRARTKTKSKVNPNNSKRVDKQAAQNVRHIRGSRSSSSSSSPQNTANRSTRSGVLQPQQISKQQETSSQRKNLPAPQKQGRKQNLENIDPQPGTSREQANINNQPGTSRVGVRQANINDQPGTSRNVVRKAPVAPANKRKKVIPVKKLAPSLKEIYHLTSTTHSLIPKLPFSRLIREILNTTSLTVNRITPEALIALQESTETYLTHLLSDSYLLTLHRSRVTLSEKDIQLAIYLRKHL